MIHQPRVAVIPETPRQSIQNAEPAIDLPQQHAAAVGGDPSLVETGDDFPPAHRLEIERTRCTLCGRKPASSLSRKTFPSKTLTLGKAGSFHLRGEKCGLGIDAAATSKADDDDTIREDIFAKDWQATSLDLVWTTLPPSPELPAGPFRLRATSKFELPAGDYDVFLQCGGHARVALNDETLWDEAFRGAVRSARMSVGQASLRFQIDYLHQTGHPVLRLWIKPRG